MWLCDRATGFESGGAADVSTFTYSFRTIRGEYHALYKRHEGNVSMSMQSYLSMRQKKASSALSVLAGFLIALLIVLSMSVTALAYEHVPPDTDPPQDLARAGVSVV